MCIFFLKKGQCIPAVEINPTPENPVQLFSFSVGFHVIRSTQLTRFQAVDKIALWDYISPTAAL